MNGGNMSMPTETTGDYRGDDDDGDGSYDDDGDGGDGWNLRFMQKECLPKIKSRLSKPC